MTKNTEHANLKEITLEEQKGLLVDLLTEIDRICGENQINYTLGGGTLLGAIRHKGFIPWDDDIDVFMLRQEYDRFLEVYPKANGKYRLLDIDSDVGYNYTFAKLINNDTLLIENIDGEAPLGVYVDIFPIDNCPNDYADAVKFMNSFRLLRWASNAKVIRINGNRVIWKNAVLAFGKVIIAPFSQRRIAKRISMKGQKYNGIDTKYVGELMINPYKEREIWEKEWFNSFVLVEFEKKLFKAVKEYNLLLKKTYGDYMQLPPVEKRVSHHDYHCYWKESKMQD